SDNVFPTGSHMITPTDQEHAQEVKHIWLDVCNCESWLDEAAKIDDDEDLPRKRESSQQKLKRRYEKGDPIVGLLGEPSEKFDYYVLYPKAEPIIKPQMDYEEFDNAESFEHLFIAKPENAESTVQFDAEEYEEHQENPNQGTPTEFPKSDIKQYFTFDDVPPSKWCEKSIEMLTWCTA
nr:putative zinc finger, CCHC-type [Tanacetum cinerariifolium]